MTKNTTRVALSIFLMFLLAGATTGLATNSVTLTKPVPLTPANLVVLENLPRTTTLAWFPVEGAVSYTVTLEFSKTGGKGSFSSVVDFTGTGITDSSLQLTAAALAEDGFYEWTVQAIGDGVNTKTGKPSEPQIFIYKTTRHLGTPAQISPANGIFLYDTALTQTLIWDSRPAVYTSAGSTPNGYNVYIEQQTGATTWTSVTGSPFNVPISTATWQNSSYTFKATTTGTYRWAVQALGDGSTALDSPAPSDSKAKEWFELTFTTP